MWNPHSNIAPDKSFQNSSAAGSAWWRALSMRIYIVGLLQCLVMYFPSWLDSSRPSLHELPHQCLLACTLLVCCMLLHLALLLHQSCMMLPLPTSSWQVSRYYCPCSCIFSVFVHQHNLLLEPSHITSALKTLYNLIPTTCRTMKACWLVQGL